MDVAAVGRDAREVDAVEQDLAGARRLEAGDHPQRRRLAAAGGPEQREELARGDLEVDPVDRDRVLELLAQSPQDHLTTGHRRLLVMSSPVPLSSRSALDSAPVCVQRPRKRYARNATPTPSSVTTTRIVASALSAGVVVPPRAFEYRYIGIVVVARVGRHVLRDDEVVDREREDDQHAREDRRREQRQQDQPQRPEGRRAEVARRLLVLRADRGEPSAHDHDDVGEREGDLADDLRRRAEVDQLNGTIESCVKTSSSDTAITISGVTSGTSIRPLAAPDAAPAPAREPDREHHARAASRSPCRGRRA